MTRLPFQPDLVALGTGEPPVPRFLKMKLMRARTSRLLLVNPRCYSLIEHIQRQRAAIQDFVVKCADIVFAAELLLRLLSQLENFELAEFVSQCLRWPGDVTIGFSLHAGLVFRRMFVEEVNHLLAR